MSFKVKKIRKTPRIKIPNFWKYFQIFWADYFSLINVFTWKRKIRKLAPARNKLRPFRVFQIITGSVVAGLGIFFVFNITQAIYGIVIDFDLKNLVFSLGSELKKDNNGFTNIFMIGVGGEDHESPDLTDSQIIVSIDQNSNIVTMLSIPRDLYLPNKQGIPKINSSYFFLKRRYVNRLKLTEEEASKKALEDFTTIIEDYSGVDIQYYVKVDFKTLEELVDILGGIEVYVDQKIYDPYYPNKNWGYDPFSIEQGKQILNGDTALKFARSRHNKLNYGASDFVRAKRQQKIILAIKEKALQKDILTSPSKLKQIYESLNSHIETNLTWTEILSLAQVVSQMGKNNLVSQVLHDNPALTGGLLFTPAREAHHGMYVLSSNYKDARNIKRLASNLVKFREMYLEPAKIQILNGSHNSGIAGKCSSYLNRFGFNIETIGNTPNRQVFETSEVKLLNPDKKITFEALKTFIEAKYDNVFYSEIPLKTGDISSPEIKKENNKIYDIVIILGEDFDLDSLDL